MIKNKKSIFLSKKDAILLIDAWAAMNCLCAYLETPDLLTERFKQKEYVLDIYRKLDKVVSKIPDSKLE